MLKESKLFEAVQAHKTFSISWVSATGELVTAVNCRCTSFHSSGKTFNIMLATSGLVRKVNRKTVTNFNGQEVFI